VAPALIVVVERKSYFEGDLVVRALPSSTWPRVSTTSNQPTWRSVLEARPTAFWIASSMLLGGTSDLDDPVNVIGHRHPSFGSVVVDS